MVPGSGSERANPIPAPAEVPGLRWRDADHVSHFQEISGVFGPGHVWPLFQMCHSCCPSLLPSSYPRVEGITHESDLANKLTSGYISIQANKNQFLYSLFHLLSQFAISHLCLVNSYFFSQCFFQKQAVLGGSGSTQ